MCIRDRIIGPLNKNDTAETKGIGKIFTAPTVPSDHRLTRGGSLNDHEDAGIYNFNLNNGDTEKPVSYTHLDVYKRQGYVSPYMVTDAERMETVLENPYILITDKKISAIKEVLPVLEKIIEVGKKDILVIAEEFEGEALATVIVNKLRGTFNLVATKTPGFGDRKKEILEDIAIVTGGKVISDDLGLKLEDVDLSMLGKARRIVITKDDTIITEGKGDKENIDARIKQIKAQITNTKSDFDKEKMQERLGKLSSGVAIIKVGAATEVEQKARKHKVEDALAATKAAIEEGIVPGGGIALLR